MELNLFDFLSKLNKIIISFKSTTNKSKTTTVNSYYLFAQVVFRGT